MKRLNLLLSLASTLSIACPAQSSGLIVVDPVAAGAPMVAFMPSIRPPVPPVTRPPVTRPPVSRPPVTRPPVTPPVTPPARPPFPVLHGSVSVGLHLKSEQVRVDINEQVARTHISQTFINETDRNLAGTYLFPLPDDTTFSSFSLHIDGKPVEGKILEADEARQQYEEIVRRMVDPGLLEYADYKTVRARIFPIPAHGTKTVELEYTQVLRAENGMLKYRFPLRTEGESAPVDEIKVDVKLASSQGLRTIWSPSHTISSNKSDDRHARVSFNARGTVPDKDFLLYYSVSDKELAANLLTHKDEGDYGYFMLTLTPPVSTKQAMAKDIVLIADTSGSMSGEKMDQCRKALKYVVNQLNAGDNFNIVQFNTDVEKFRSQLVPASAENKKAAIAYIDEMEARGGTNIGDALKTGKSMLNHASERPAYMVFMTDGEPTVGETDISKLIKSAENSRKIRIFDFGVGYEVNTRLLNKLSELNHGTSQYVEPEENIETAVANFYQKVKSPMLSDVQIAYEGIQVKDVYPREVTDIFAGSQVLLMGKYKGDGRATVRLTGKVNGVVKAYSFPLTFAKDEPGHTYLPRLWAMRRIGYLTEIAQENGNTREVVNEIVALSKKYGIISAYTSYLVTEPNMASPPRPTATPVPLARSATRELSPDDFLFAPTASRAARSSGRATGGWSGARMEAPMIQGGTNGAIGPQAGDSTVVAGLNTRGTWRVNSVAKAPGWNPFVFGAKQDSFSDEIRARSSAPEPRPQLQSGRDAVERAKELDKLKRTSVIANERKDESAAIKSIEDKTFYMQGGFWTDSAYDPARSPKAETITFGSQEYFDLVRNVKGIGKYLAAGKQVILVFRGHTYRIVAAKST